MSAKGFSTHSRDYKAFHSIYILLNTINGLTYTYKSLLSVLRLQSIPLIDYLVIGVFDRLILRLLVLKGLRWWPLLVVVVVLKVNKVNTMMIA